MFEVLTYSFIRGILDIFSMAMMIPFFILTFMQLLKNVNITQVRVALVICEITIICLYVIKLFNEVMFRGFVINIHTVMIPIILIGFSYIFVRGLVLISRGLKKAKKSENL